MCIRSSFARNGMQLTFRHRIYFLHSAYKCEACGNVGLDVGIYSDKPHKQPCRCGRYVYGKKQVYFRKEDFVPLTHGEVSAHIELLLKLIRHDDVSEKAGKKEDCEILKTS